MTFRPGELDQRVTVSRKTLTPDLLGGATQTFTDLKTYWSHVRPLSGKEIANYDGLQNEVLYLFVFRNGLDIKPDDILKWRSENYNIRVIKQPKNRALYTEVEAERGVAL